MIERIILFKLREDLSNPAGRAAIARELAAKLSTTSAAEPKGNASTVGLPADAASERSWDLALTLRFESPPPASPAPESALLAVLGDRLLLHKAWSFERLESS